MATLQASLLCCLCYIYALPGVWYCWYVVIWEPYRLRVIYAFRFIFCYILWYHMACFDAYIMSWYCKSIFSLLFVDYFIFSAALLLRFFLLFSFLTPSSRLSTLFLHYIFFFFVDYYCYYCWYAVATMPYAFSFSGWYVICIFSLYDAMIFADVIATCWYTYYDIYALKFPYIHYVYLLDILIYMMIFTYSSQAPLPSSHCHFHSSSFFHILLLISCHYSFLKCLRFDVCAHRSVALDAYFAAISMPYAFVCRHYARFDATWCRRYARAADTRAAAGRHYLRSW